jgi:hypothetical protein
LVQFYVQKIHESELLFLVVRLTFLERLHINHIARNDIWDKITLPSGAFATDTPFTSIKDFYLMKDNFVC